MTAQSKSFDASYGPTALITGALDGIGRAMAEDIASWGSNVVLVARRKERLEHLATKRRALRGTKATVIAADLGTAPGLHQSLAAIDALGRGAPVRPGFLSWFLGHSPAALPRPARSRILGRIMSGVTKHRNAQEKT